MRRGGDRPGRDAFQTTPRPLYDDSLTSGRTYGVTPHHGHSKDHREDVKQILFTWFVNRDGVPRMGTVEDGNRCENGRARQRMDRIVPPSARRRCGTWSTPRTLDARAAAGIAWLSRRRGPRKSGSRRGRVAQRPTETISGAREQPGWTGDRAYRLVVYRSSGPRPPPVDDPGARGSPSPRRSRAGRPDLRVGGGCCEGGRDETPASPSAGEPAAGLGAPCKQPCSPRSTGRPARAWAGTGPG